MRFTEQKGDGRVTTLSDLPVLSIGVLSGGPGTNKEWKESVTALMRRVIDERDGITSPLALNVIFQLPGRNLKPDFVGLRTGKFSRRESRLLVQVAVPDSVSDNPKEAAIVFLSEAIQLAEDFAIERGISGPLVGLRSLLSRL